MSSELQVVVAFIQPFELGAVVDAVRQIPNFQGMSGSGVRGFGSELAENVVPRIWPAISTSGGSGKSVTEPSSPHSARSTSTGVRR